MSDQNGRRIMEFPRVETVNPNAVTIIDGDEHGTSSIRLSTLLSYIQNGIEFPDQTPEFNLADVAPTLKAAVTDSAKLLIQPDTGSQASITVKNFLDAICNSDLEIPVASKEYVATKIAELINGAPETMDTLKELGDAITENKDVLEALNTLTQTVQNSVTELKSELDEDVSYLQERCDFAILERPMDAIQDTDLMILGKPTEDSEGTTTVQNKKVTVGELKEVFGSGGVSDGVDFTNLTEVEEVKDTDVLLVGTGDPISNEKVDMTKFMSYVNDHMDISKLPKGTKAITKEFTISANNANSGTICNLSDFGNISSVDIISLLGYCINKQYPVSFAINDDKKSIDWVYFNAISFSNYTFSVTLIVKDYSEIGSEIVTQNVKMLTKEVTFNFNNELESWVLLSDEFPDVSIDDIVGVTSKNGNIIKIENGTDSNPYLVTTAKSTWTGSWKTTVSLIVKVPVVEQLPRFTKDIQITFGGGAAKKILDLDGSENCGGYTKDNIHSVSLLDMDGIGLTLATTIRNDGIWAFSQVNTNTYTGKFRISIE